MLQKALITGAAGFIGSNLTKKLLENNIEILAIDDFSSGKESNLPSKNKKLNIKKISILDYDLNKLIQISSQYYLSFNFLHKLVSLHRQKIH